MAEPENGRSITRLWAALAAVGVAGLLLGSLAYVILRSGSGAASCSGGQVAGGDLGGPFTLVDETGRTVTDADVITGPVLIYFGYTFCPDVCPLDAARNAEAVDILEEMGIEVTPVFISFDPARDTPEVLAEFTDNLHPRMVGLTGSVAQIDAASKAYRTYFRVSDPAEEYYLIDHSTFTYFVQPGTGFVDFFRNETTAQDMAERVACFIGES